MTFIAKVYNGVIALPPGIDLEDGAAVEVQAIETPVQNAAKSQSWMRRYIGAAKNLPEDFAAEHDHYIHGTPKKKG